MNKNFAKPVRFNKLLAKLQPDSYFRYGGAWYFFGWWIVGNMVGTGLGITVGLINASALLKFPIDIVLWSITGVTVGFTQKLALQHWFNLKYWVWFSLVGWLLVGVFARYTGINLGIIGAVVGAMQCLVLRHHIGGAGWWIVANALGLILGASFGWSIRFTSRWSFFKQLIAIDERVLEFLDWIIAGLTGGAIAGIITGLCLMWLLSVNQYNLSETSTSKSGVKDDN